MCGSIIHIKSKLYYDETNDIYNINIPEHQIWF